MTNNTHGGPPMSRLHELRQAGISIWLDTLSRELLDGGHFAELIADHAVTAAELRIEAARCCEQMLGDEERATTLFGQVFVSEAPIERIVEANSFQNLSKGRAQGQESGRSFFRKGVAGDWRNQFTPETRSLYKDRIGQFLIETGYERDLNW